MSLNRIALLGRLTADPEYRQTPNGTAVAMFTVAVERNFASNGERQTDFIPCVAWRQSADFVSRYFQKGSMIAVDGSLQTRKYTDKQGNNRTVYEVVVDQVSFTGSKSETTDNKPQKTEKPKKSLDIDCEWESVDNDDDGLPF